MSDIYKKDWRKLRIAVVDTETTDLEHTKDRIVEIGIIIFIDGKPVERYCKLINPGLNIEGKPIPPDGMKITAGSSKVSGIMNEDVVGKKLFEERALKIKRYMNEKADVWCMFNDQFDRSFINAEFHRAGVELEERPCIDPLIWAYHYWPTLPNKLDDICQKLRIMVNKKDLERLEINTNRHRADYDAFLTGAVLFGMQIFLPKTLRQTLYVQDFLYRNWLLQYHNNESKYMRYLTPTMPPEHSNDDK